MTSLRKIRIAVVLGAIAALAVVACQTPPAAEEAPDYAAELKPVFDTVIEVWNSQEYDKLSGVLAENFRRIAPDQDADGLQAMIEFMRQVHTAYPDFQITAGEEAYAENLSFNQWTATGTATREDGTTAPFELTGVTMLRYADGKITEEWAYFDTAALMEQVGMSAVPHVE